MTVTLPPLGWPYFYERLRSLPDLSEELSADGEAAFAFLGKELGKGFFKTCGKNHPVSHKLMMAGGEGQLKELVKWVDVLKHLKDADSNYRNLSDKLRSKSKASAEAIPFLEVSARHLEQGFNVHFPKEEQGQKNPDIVLTYHITGEKIFVEVTKIGEGDEQEKKERLYRKLLNLCQWSGYNALVAGKLYELVPDDQLALLTGKLTAMMQEADQNIKLITYRDDYLLIAFAHPDCLAELDKWCAELKLARRFDGFDVKFDYTSRMIKNSRLRKEAKQIPDGTPGLIYCAVHILFPLTMNVPETVAAFAKELEKYQHIFGLVFYGEVMPPLDEPFTVENEYFAYALRRNEAHAGRYTLMVKNPSFNLPLSEAARTALVNAAV